MLISKSEFIGLEEVAHLGAGGESPMLKTHREAINRFFEDKAMVEAGRERLDETCSRCKEKAGLLLGVKPEDIAFLSSSSEGINLLVHALTWNPGDNVVVADVEFPSLVLPWTQLEKLGVEIRVVRNRKWFVSLEDVEAAIDDRTKVVAVSHVSYFTGQRLPLEELSRMVRSTNALFVVDATHSAGVVPVEAVHADILVSSCYKWLLGTHGVALLYWNQQRMPHLEPPFVGWHTGVSIPDWENPTAFTPRSDAARFEAGAIELETSQFYYGDVNQDGTVDILDAFGIAQAEAGLMCLPDLGDPFEALLGQ